MIIDTVKNVAQYEKLSPAITKALKVLSNQHPINKNLINQPDGRYDVDGDDLFFLIQRYTTKPGEGGKLEAHEKYIDVQYVVSGEEMIGYAPAGLLEVDTLYNKEIDAAFYKSNDKMTRLNLESGMFAVFYPEDAHMPCCQLDGPAEVHKIVVKIRV